MILNVLNCSDSTVSASSFGYMPYPQPPRLPGDQYNQHTYDEGRSGEYEYSQLASKPGRSRVEQHHQPSNQLITKIKRHKSFFNSDALKEKKNLLLRRTESFHQDNQNFR